MRRSTRGCSGVSFAGHSGARASANPESTFVLWFTWIPGPIWFALKIAMTLFVFLWVRATFPRYRYDQLMRLGWKVFLPLSLLWVVLTAGFLLTFDMVPPAGGA